jgi:hypothetical protein
MATNANTIIEQLTSLPKSELAKVRASMNLLAPAGGNAAKQAKAETDEALVLGQLAAVLRRHGEQSPPLPVILKTKDAKCFKDGCAVLAAYARTHLRPDNRAEMLQALRVLLDVLVRYIVSRERPVTFRTACRHLGTIAAAVEQEFPGYRAAGMLTVVLNPKALRRK